MDRRLVLAPLGGIGYIIWPNDVWWNYGAFTVAPLIALGAWRQHRLEQEGNRSEPAGWAGTEGPYGPP